MKAKCTRYHYMKEVGRFLKTKNYKNDNVLEISGHTQEWLRYFKSKTIAKFPEVDAHKLPYKNASFDAVICNQVLEHVRKPWVCVEEFRRVLVDGGILIISSPFIYQEHNYPVDNWRFTPSGLEVLCEDFSEVLILHRGGNSKMIEHMIKHPTDRRSDEFYTFLDVEEEKLYYTTSTIVVKK